LTELRETVAESSSTLRLDVGEHDRLCSVLHEADTGEFLVRRLDESAPGCDLCDKRGYVQIRVDGSEPWTICADYKAALVSTDNYRLFQRIDSEITSETDVTIEWPKPLRILHRKLPWNVTTSPEYNQLCGSG
jgi:hypothetical protein